jgi:type IV pilus assembly protein PilO
MAKTRSWVAGASVVALLLVVAAWFLLISPQRSEAATLREQAVQQQQANEQIKLKTQQLKAQFASLPARQAQLAEIKQQMPDNPALPSLIRDLSTYAEDAGVVLVSVAPANPAPFAATAAPVTTAAAPAAPLQQIQTSVIATGSYAELTLYLQKLQSKMRRAVLVENITLAKANGDKVPAGDLQMTLATKVFVLDTQAATQAAAAASKSVPASGTAK